MSEPFTIRIFVPDGDPEGVRIIDRMNWTGLGVVFPRESWPQTRKRSDFSKGGVYILVGFTENEDIPTLYIGQTDNLGARFNRHIRDKDFWDWACVFVSTNEGLNRAHITWLEWALVQHARKANRSILENSVSPQEPSLSESEKADTRAFLKEILQILPLVGLRAFEIPKPISEITRPKDSKTSAALGLKTKKDTVIVPAQRDGFLSAFLGESAWYAIRISGGMRDKLKWIAAYQTQPVSAITHIAEIDHIEPYGESGKFKLVFKGTPKELDNPIPYGDAPGGAMQGPRYTTYKDLLAAKKLTDLL